jgi:hypothetical protein
MVSTSFGGLQDMRSGHLALVLPMQGQLALRLPGPYAGQTERHMTHGRPCPCAGQIRAPPSAWAASLRGADPRAMWHLGTPERDLALGGLQCEGQTQAPPGTWILAKDPIAYGSPTTTWRKGSHSATWRFTLLL